MTHEQNNEYLASQNKTYLLGLANDIDRDSIKDLGVIAFTRDKDGSAPTVSTAGTNDVKSLLDSTDAKKAAIIDEMFSFSEEEIRKLQDDLTGNLLKVAKAVKAMRLGTNIYDTEYTNRIIYKRNVSDLMKVGEGINLINQILPGYLGKAQVDELLGIKGNEPVAPIVIDNVIPVANRSE
jgi:hypothetical protein